MLGNRVSHFGQSFRFARVRECQRRFLFRLVSFLLLFFSRARRAVFGRDDSKIVLLSAASHMTMKVGPISATRFKSHLHCVIKKKEKEKETAAMKRVRASFLFSVFFFLYK